jgi:Ca2+-binding RTX toxin-like protein
LRSCAAGNDTVIGGARTTTRSFGDAGIDKLLGETGDDSFYVRKPRNSLAADNDTVDGGLG